MASLATTNGAQNRRWASTRNKNATETHNLKILILVKCSSLCCAKWFFTQHSHMPSPALKQRVHRHDTASKGTTRTNALLVLNKKNTRIASASLTPRITNAHRYESSTRLLCRSHQAHRHRNQLVSPHVANNEEHPMKTKNHSQTLWPPSMPQKRTSTGKRKNELRANYLSKRRNVSYLDHERNTKKQKSEHLRLKLQYRDWMFVILLDLNRTSFDLEM